MTAQANRIGPCPDLEQELEDFLEDPITVAYGAQECGTLLVAEHLKRCKRCQEARKRGEL